MAVNREQLRVMGKDTEVRGVGHRKSQNSIFAAQEEAFFRCQIFENILVLYTLLGSVTKKTHHHLF